MSERIHSVRSSFWIGTGHRVQSVKRIATTLNSFTNNLKAVLRTHRYRHGHRHRLFILVYFIAFYSVRNSGITCIDIKTQTVYVTQFVKVKKDLQADYGNEREKPWDPQDDEDSSRGLLGCDTVKCCGSTATFRSTTLPPSSGWSVTPCSVVVG